MPAKRFSKPSQTATSSTRPLADRMRPQTLKEFVGQKPRVGRSKIITTLLQNDQIPSLIFWGPPGSGKTTLAKIIANETKSEFVFHSAVEVGINEVKKEIHAAEQRQDAFNQKTILCIDEIHRWNKSQQAFLLPHVEDGTIILIGSTTENPSFEVNSPLLSRTKVYIFYQLAEEELATILRRAIEDERGLKAYNPEIKEEALQFIISN